MQIEPDILNQAMGFKQIPYMQKPNVWVQSRTIEPAKAKCIKIINKGEQEYRKGKLKPIKSLAELDK